MPGTPRKTAAPTKRAARKPSVTVEEPAETNGAVVEDEVTKVTFELVQGDDTKTYAKFSPPADSGCVGTLYVPHGTEMVKVMLVGPA